MLWRRKRGYPCDYSPHPEPEDEDAARRILARTTSVYERSKPWLTDAMAEFGYAGALGMPLEDDELPLASGPALFTFEDQSTTGTVLITDRRAMFVWLDRHVNPAEVLSDRAQGHELPR
jgi:hypothetical protein